MPGPSNTLLIEGSFTELSEELAQYLDTVSKSEADSGVQSEIAPSLTEIREKEQAEEAVDQTSIKKQKDEVLKKIVGKAGVLNSAPEKGQLATLSKKYNIDSLCRVHCGLQSSHTPVKSVRHSGHVSRSNMLLPFRPPSYVLPPVWRITGFDASYHHLQHPA